MQAPLMLVQSREPQAPLMVTVPAQSLETQEVPAVQIQATPEVQRVPEVPIQATPEVQRVPEVQIQATPEAPVQRVLEVPATPEVPVQAMPEVQRVPEVPVQAMPEAPVQRVLEVPATPEVPIQAMPEVPILPEVPMMQKMTPAEKGVEPSLAVPVTAVAAQPPLVLMLTPPAETSTAEVPPAKNVKRAAPQVAKANAARLRAKKRTRRAFLIALRDMVIALALLALLLQFFSPTIVREHSMENTLKENEILYVGQKAYWFGDPKRGDIVVFHSTLTDEKGDEKTLVKRIIGLPGDRIAIDGGVVYRNGQTLSEPYVKGGVTRGELDELVVPEDSYFVLGDNRDVSNDSRNAEIGFIDKSQLRGKVLLRIFPLSNFRVF
jgi:signal peptidase I